MAPMGQAALEPPQIAVGGGMLARSTTLDSVALRNFKGHEDLRLDMARITVLIGPTSSGKSTVLQALDLLRSALGAGYFRALGGSQEYGRFEDIVTGGDSGREVGIGIGGRKKMNVKDAGDIDARFSYDVEFDGSLYPTRLRASVDLRRDSPPPQDHSMSLVHDYDAGAGTTRVSGGGMPDGSEASVHGDRSLAPGITIASHDHLMNRAFHEMFSGGEFFRSLLDGLRRVPFSRVVTSYMLPIEYHTDILSPDRAKGAASLISRISSSRSLQDRISGMMEEVGLRRIATRNIPVSKGEDRMLTLDFVRNGAFNPIVHEGTGLNQLVGLLAVLTDSPRGSVITIEEPEIHLDPAAQARLLGILVRQAVEEDKQIIFTTHSDHLLYPLLAYVKKKDCLLTKDDVAMHYFNTDESGGMDGVERLAINEHGQIKGGLKGFWYADGLAMSEILG